MIHPKENVGTPCPVCKRTIELFDFHDIDPYTGCSEFCASTTEADKQKYLNVKPGEWCVYPCAECGFAIEDEWNPDSPHLCSDCVPKRQLRVRTAQLKLTRDALKALLPEVPSNLLEGIENTLKGIENALQEYPRKIDSPQ